MCEERRLPPDWAEARPFFQRDGLLRDVQCEGSPEAWHSWLRFLAEQRWLLEYRMAVGPIAPIFEFPSVDEDTERPILVITLGTGPTLHSFFFDEDEIDVDLNPEEFVSELQWRELLEFLALLGATTGGEVRLSPEGDHRHPWLIYRSDQNAWATAGQPDDNIVKG